MITSVTMSAMRDEFGKIKQAEIDPASGAALGNLLLGAPGAAVGAHIGMDRGRSYSGTPWLRGGLGSLGGAMVGALPGAAMIPFAPAAGIPIAIIGAGTGSTIGAALGAGSVRSYRRKGKTVRAHRRKKKK